MGNNISNNFEKNIENNNILYILTKYNKCFQLNNNKLTLNICTKTNSKYKGLNVLHIAVLLNKNDLVKKLLGKIKLNKEKLNNSIYKNIIDKKTSDGKNNTPLIFACMEGNINIVQALVKYGANIFLKNSEGKTAYDYVKNDKTKDEIKYYFNSLILNKKQINNFIKEGFNSYYLKS